MQMPLTLVGFIDCPHKLNLSSVAPSSGYSLDMHACTHPYIRHMCREQEEKTTSTYYFYDEKIINSVFTEDKSFSLQLTHFILIFFWLFFHTSVKSVPTL